MSKGLLGKRKQDKQDFDCAQQHASLDEVSKATKKAKQVSGIKFIKGFCRPMQQDSLKAVGKGVKNNKQFLPCNFFNLIPPPTTVDDWLAHVKEDGQSYEQFKYECPWISGRSVKYWKSKFNLKGKCITARYPEGKIYLLPICSANDNSLSITFDALVEYATIFLGIPVVFLPQVTIKLPTKEGDNAFLDTDQLEWLRTDQSDKRRLSKRLLSQRKRIEFRLANGHLQLNVTSIIRVFQGQLPSDALCLVGLTMEDLYEESSDLFVAGLAAGNTRVAVFSFSRYDPDLKFSPEHWYDVEKSTTKSLSNQPLIFKHSCKLLVHEICHLLGLDHCIWYECCMNGSGHLQEDFRQPMFLCPVDLRKLQTLTDFDILERYRKLLDFFKSRGYMEETDWLERRLKFLAD